MRIYLFHGSHDRQPLYSTLKGTLIYGDAQGNNEILRNGKYFGDARDRIIDEIEPAHLCML